MAIKTLVSFDEKTSKIILDGFERPLKKCKVFFDLLGAYMHGGQISLTFKFEGERAGHKKWNPFSLRTLHPSEVKGALGSAVFINTKKWNKRPGTDGAKTRRYSANSKLLQASGSFMRSFGIMKTTNKRLKYGTNYEKAKEIIGDREVLFVMPADYRTYTSMFSTFIDQEIKF